VTRYLALGLVVVLVACGQRRASPAPPTVSAGGDDAAAPVVVAIPAMDAAPPVVKGGVHESGAGKTKAAIACLAELACPAAEAERLFLAGDDGADPEVDCYRFLDGAGTARDVVRGRACLERSVVEMRCKGSSVDLGLVELAVMAIDGVGGPQDIAKARALLADCFDDVAKQAVLEHADAKTRDPKTRAMDFCKEAGGTTLTNDVCQARRRDGAQALEQLRAKAVYAPLDARARTSLAEVEKRYGEYVDAMVSYVVSLYEGGTMRGAAGLAMENTLRQARAAELASFSAFAPGAPTKADVDKALGDQARAVAQAPRPTPAARAAFKKAETAWDAYRVADRAFYERVFGATEQVRAAVNILLAEQRAKDVLASE
jgi:hypothetical protein